MSRVTGLLLLVLSLCLFASKPASAERVKLALPSKSMGYLPLFVAQNRGFFKDENIELEVVMMLPDIAHSALFQGEIDYHGAADSALRLGAKGAPIRTIFFGAALPNYFLMAGAQIKSVAELKGRYVGISRFGGTTDLAARVALSKNNLDPQRDVVLVMIGLPATRIAALMSGAVAATIANPPDNVVLRQKGFNELLFLGDAIEFPSNGFSTTEKKLSAERGGVKRLVRALYRGLVFARERPADTVAIIEREWRLDPAVAKESYASVLKSISRDGAASEAGMRVHADIIRRTEKGLGEIPLNKMVDFRIVEEVRREGAR
ncbi:MAG TPA: ABC transporter substrate-binding protein [Candidatus Binatia bacterium]